VIIDTLEDESIEAVTLVVVIGIVRRNQAPDPEKRVP
jgi:hypothetical protein